MMLSITHLLRFLISEYIYIYSLLLDISLIDLSSAILNSNCTSINSSYQFGII